MSRTPPANAALNGACACECKENTQWEASRVAAMAPEAVVAACYTEGGHGIVDDRPNESWEDERGGTRKVEAIEGNQDNESSVEPIDLLVPVAPCERLFRDM